MPNMFGQIGRALIKPTPKNIGRGIKAMNPTPKRLGAALKPGSSPIQAGLRQQNPMAKPKPGGVGAAMGGGGIGPSAAVEPAMMQGGLAAASPAVPRNRVNPQQMMQMLKEKRGMMKQKPPMRRPGGNVAPGLMPEQPIRQEPQQPIRQEMQSIPEQWSQPRDEPPPMMQQPPPTMGGGDNPFGALGWGNNQGPVQQAPMQQAPPQEEMRAFNPERGPQQEMQGLGPSEDIRRRMMGGFGGGDYGGMY